jgi:hypothetical protein
MKRSSPCVPGFGFLTLLLLLVPSKTLVAASCASLGGNFTATESGSLISSLNAAQNTKVI